jgi:hypothetical protein
MPIPGKFKPGRGVGMLSVEGPACCESQVVESRDGKKMPGDGLIAASMPCFSGAYASGFGVLGASRMPST